MRPFARISAGLLAVLIVVFIFLLALAWDAAQPSRLLVDLRKVKFGMSQAEVEAIFDGPADAQLPLGAGYVEHVWWGRNSENSASVMMLFGRVISRLWSPSNRTVVEKIQNRLGMPWWGSDEIDVGLRRGEKAENGGWEIFRLEAPKVEVNFPGKPTVDETTPDVTDVTIQDDETIYTLTIGKFPVPLAVLEDPALAKQLIDDLHDSAFHIVGTRMVSRKDFLWNQKYPARTLETTIKGRAALQHIIVTPHHSYVVAVGGSKEFVESRDAKRFLDSFKISE